MQLTLLGRAQHCIEVRQVIVGSAASLVDAPAHFRKARQRVAFLIVPVLDRGFIFGDGVYEVVPVYSKVPFRLEEHLVRLERSLAAVGIRNPYTPEQWRGFVAGVIDRQDFDDQGVYFQVTRGVAKRDHAFPKDAAPTVFMVRTFDRLTRISSRGASALE